MMMTLMKKRKILMQLKIVAASFPCFFLLEVLLFRYFLPRQIIRDSSIKTFASWDLG